MAELGIDGYLSILTEHHHIVSDDMEVVVEDLEEFNPFRMFLKRSIYGILEFDRVIAFVFRSHILFFGKDSNQLRVHIKPEKKQSFFLCFYIEVQLMFIMSNPSPRSSSLKSSVLNTSMSRSSILS